jgi:CheY-like chemotaxis protein
MRPCVLIVEDDRDIRESLQEILEFEGYEVLTATNGKEGVEALSRMPRPCLILLDLMMPVMNGWQFLEAQKSNHCLATIPVVVVSAVSERDKAAGAAAFIKKPVDLESLLKTVEKYCQFCLEKDNNINKLDKTA